MPNRMLRDWTMSDKVVLISVHAERFFVRLIMKADDYGCFHADVRLLKANLFPLLLDNIREADLLRWMAECQKAGLVVLYESEGKKYVRILDFRQRLDKARSKYPLPTSHDFPELVNEFRAEVEVEVEVEKKSTAPPAPNAPSFKKMTEKEFGQAIALHTEKFPKEMLRKFYEYWKEPSATGRMRFQLEKTWETHRRLTTWHEREGTFKKPDPKTESAPVRGIIENRTNAILDQFS